MSKTQRIFAAGVTSLIVLTLGIHVLLSQAKPGSTREAFASQVVGDAPSGDSMRMPTSPVAEPRVESATGIQTAPASAQRDSGPLPSDKLTHSMLTCDLPSDLAMIETTQFVRALEAAHLARSTASDETLRCLALTILAQASLQQIEGLSDESLRGLLDDAGCSLMPLLSRAHDDPILLAGVTRIGLRVLSVATADCLPPPRECGSIFGGALQLGIPGAVEALFEFQGSRAPAYDEYWDFDRITYGEWADIGWLPVLEASLDSPGLHSRRSAGFGLQALVVFRESPEARRILDGYCHQVLEKVSLHPEPSQAEVMESVSAMARVGDCLLDPQWVEELTSLALHPSRDIALSAMQILGQSAERIDPSTRNQVIDRLALIAVNDDGEMGDMAITTTNRLCLGDPRPLEELRALTSRPGQLALLSHLIKSMTTDAPR